MGGRYEPRIDADDTAGEVVCCTYADDEDGDDDPYIAKYDPTDGSAFTIGDGIWYLEVELAAREEIAEEDVVDVAEEVEEAMEMMEDDPVVEEEEDVVEATVVAVEDEEVEDEVEIDDDDLLSLDFLGLRFLV